MRLRWLTIVLVAFGLLSACAQAEPTPAPPRIPTPTPEPTPVPPPDASPVADPGGGSAPLLVSFANTSPGPVTTREWDFGDGSSSTEQDPTHEYTRAGSYIVRLAVSGPGGSDVATLREIITVSPGPLAGVISPTTITLQVQRTTRLGATAVDQFGNEISDSAFTWTAASPLGSIDATGLLTAGTEAGTHARLVKVTATQGEQTREASVDVTITPGPLATVAVEPAEVTLDIGESQAFTFTAFDEFGNEITDVLARWTAGVGIGNVGADGLLTTGKNAGPFPSALRVDVVQEAARASATANVSIRPGPLATIEVTPSSIDVEQGATHQFTAVGVDQYGNRIAGLAFLWQATGGDIDQAGVFTAGSAASSEVRASATSGQRVIIASASVLTPVPFETIWDDLIQAAQDEGALVLRIGGASGRNYGPVAQFFGEKFGIKVAVSTNSSSDLTERILAEQAAGRYVMDITFLDPTEANTRLVPANALDPIADLFIHPEVTDLSLWFGGKHWYADEAQRYVFTLSAEAGPIMPMWYNSNLVTQADIDSINSVFDYLDPKWKGKIVAQIPIADGSYYEAYVHPDIGKDWLDAFVAPELGVTFANDQRFIVDGIARGKFHLGIAIGGAGHDLEALAALGLAVQRFPCTTTGQGIWASVCVKQLKEGGVIAGAGSQNNMMIPTNRPHPNAAKLFVNWFLSREGQTIMHTLSEQDPDQTLRLDVTDLGKTLPSERRDPDRKYYFFSSDPAYMVQREKALQYAKDAYGAAR